MTKNSSTSSATETEVATKDESLTPLQDITTPEQSPANLASSSKEDDEILVSPSQVVPPAPEPQNKPLKLRVAYEVAEWFQTKIKIIKRQAPIVIAEKLAPNWLCWITTYAVVDHVLIRYFFRGSIANINWAAVIDIETFKMFVLGSIFTVLLSKVFFNKLTHHEWLSEKIKGETASACTNLGSLATIGFFLKPYAFTGLGFLGVAMLLYLFALVVYALETR